MGKATTTKPTTTKATTTKSTTTKTTTTKGTTTKPTTTMETRPTTQTTIDPTITLPTVKPDPCGPWPWAKPKWGSKCVFDYKGYCSDPHVNDLKSNPKGTRFSRILKRSDESILIGLRVNNNRQKTINLRA